MASTIYILPIYLADTHPPLPLHQLILAPGGVLVSEQTKGPPPSPSQVSRPFSPPAFGIRTYGSVIIPAWIHSFGPVSSLFCLPYFYPKQGLRTYSGHRLTSPETIFIGHLWIPRPGLEHRVVFWYSMDSGCFSQSMGYLEHSKSEVDPESKFLVVVKTLTSWFPDGMCLTRTKNMTTSTCTEVWGVRLPVRHRGIPEKSLVK